MLTVDDTVDKVLDAYDQELREFLYDLEAILGEEKFLKILEELGFYDVLGED